VAHLTLPEQPRSLAYWQQVVRSNPKLQTLLTPKLSDWIPHQPHPKQAAFLWLQGREAFYGGAAGGGKSDALLMAALQYADVPGYSAILFRRTFADLDLPDAIMDRSLEWLSGTKAHWSSQGKQWTFPSGATLTFAYLATERDKYRYQSAQFQFIGFDELTQFPETQYLYLFSRLRRLKDGQVPLRMRSASNPGGIGHEWVKQRFIVEGRTFGRVFIAASLSDNPSLDQDTYRLSLAELDPHTRAQLLQGDWDTVAGTKFQREWFPIVAEAPADCKWVRYWDRAATEKGGDWTVGVKMGVKDGIFFLTDIQRTQSTPKVVEDLIKQTAEVDGLGVEIWMEQEPGSSGVDTIDNYRRRVLAGYTFRGDKVTGSKEERANPVSSQAEAGNIRLVRGTWIGAYLDEVSQFPGGSHDDQVDATSGAFSKLSGGSRVFLV